MCVCVEINDSLADGLPAFGVARATTTGTWRTAVGETIILLHPPLCPAGVIIGMGRGVSRMAVCHEPRRRLHANLVGQHRRPESLPSVWPMPAWRHRPGCCDEVPCDAAEPGGSVSMHSKHY